MYHSKLYDMALEPQISKGAQEASDESKEDSTDPSPSTQAQVPEASSASFNLLPVCLLLLYVTIVLQHLATPPGKGTL